MNNFIIKHFKILNRIFGRFRWFQVMYRDDVNIEKITKKLINDMTPKEIDKFLEEML